MKHLSKLFISILVLFIFSTSIVWGENSSLHEEMGQVNESSEWIVRWIENPLQSTDLWEVLDQDIEHQVSKIYIPNEYVGVVLKQFEHDSNIAFIEPNFVYSLSANFNDPLFPDQHYLQQTGIKDAWDLVTPDANLTIAIVDTGIDLYHPDLKDNLVPGFNLLDPKRSPHDDNGHGTTVAGVVGAKANNQEGIAGIMYRSRIMPIKVMGRHGEGEAYDVARGIRVGVNQGADIVLLSVGDPIYSKFMEEAVQYAESKGVLVVAATGNKGAEVEYPAAFPTVLAVGAVDERDRIGYYSNTGQEVDVVAPGNNIVTTELGGDYIAVSGTSLAAPQVAGLAGLILSKYPDYTPAQVRNLIRYSAKPLSRHGWDELSGYGRIDAVKALTVSLPSNIHAPHDTSRLAARLPLGKQLDAAFKNEEDINWYKIDVPYNGTLYLNVLNIKGLSEAGIRVTIYNNDLTRLIGYQSNKITYRVSEGTYYIKLEIINSKNKLSEVTYSMESSFNIYSDSYEPNNTKAMARNIPLDQGRLIGTIHQDGDEDWFRFKLPVGGRFSFTLTTDSLRLDPVVTVIKPDQTIQVFDQGNWENYQMEKGAFDVTDGDLYIKINNYYGIAVNAEYTLRWDFEPYFVDVHEPNNTILTATQIKFDETLYAHIGSPSDLDWYTFNVNNVGLYQFDGANFPSHIPARIAIYDQKYKRLTQMNIGRNQTRGSSQLWLEKGTYFIRVDADSAFTNQFYELTVSPIDAVYKDIGTSWARESINRMARAGVIKGYTDLTFRPDNPITRAEFTNLMVEILGISKGSRYARSPFSDVRTNHWAFTSIVGAYNQSFLTGYEDGTFHPDAPITRAEMVTLLVKGLKIKPAHNSDKLKSNSQVAVQRFTDIKRDYWAVNSISDLVQLKLITGYEDGTFRPGRYSTRAEVATLLERIWYVK